VPFAKRIAAVLAALLALSVVAPAAAYHENGDHPFGDPRFEERRDRTERPVIEGEVDRTWIWGPSPYTEAFFEPYADSPDGERMVQYFDKSRMEINDPDAEGLWAVTNGLLVVEMIEGAIQIGDAEFDHSPEPADMPIAGDVIGAEGPTYADIASFELPDVEPRAVETVIDEYLTMTRIESSPEYAEHGITGAVHVSETNNTVAQPFWEFMNSEGLVFEQGEYVVDNLFQNPFYATGYPVTEAYWTTTPVEGETRDVLWQCFERRCLTYTPDNPEGWQVESGNVGLHYYLWRYGEEGHATQDIHVALHAPGDAGAIGDEFGCQDSLVPVDTHMHQQVTVENEVRVALQKMFSYDHLELSNLFLGQPIFVHTVGVSEGIATIWLVGDPGIVGVCDEPRFQAQIQVTAMQFDEVNHVEIILNGEEWEPGQEG
jgi:hypothetical protein